MVLASVSPISASGVTFGEWASDQGYAPGDALPGEVSASDTPIDSLDGIGAFDWTTTPTTSLFLDENRISSIEAGTFSGLTKLTELRLDENGISSIESDDFSGLTNLTKLDLSFNVIASIEPGTFSELTHLTTLRLGKTS